MLYTTVFETLIIMINISKAFVQSVPNCIKVCLIEKEIQFKIPIDQIIFCLTFSRSDRVCDTLVVIIIQTRCELSLFFIPCFGEFVLDLYLCDIVPRFYFVPKLYLLIPVIDSDSRIFSCYNTHQVRT